MTRDFHVKARVTDSTGERMNGNSSCFKPVWDRVRRAKGRPGRPGPPCEGATWSMAQASGLGMLLAGERSENRRFQACSPPQNTPFHTVFSSYFRCLFAVYHWEMKRRPKVYNN